MFFSTTTTHGGGGGAADNGDGDEASVGVGVLILNICVYSFRCGQSLGMGRRIVFELLNWIN